MRRAGDSFIVNARKNSRAFVQRALVPRQVLRPG